MGAVLIRLTRAKKETKVFRGFFEACRQIDFASESSHFLMVKTRSPGHELFCTVRSSQILMAVFWKAPLILTGHLHHQNSAGFLVQNNSCVELRARLRINTF